LSADALWTVEAVAGPERTVVQFTCNFLYTCMGYYDYEGGYTPEWKGVELFGDRFVHPQKWPGALDYEGKRVVVIGSGATAVTLVPELAERAAHVTMLSVPPLTSSRGPPKTRWRTGCDDTFPPARPTHSRVGRTCCWGCFFTSWLAPGPISLRGWWRRRCVSTSASNMTSSTLRHNMNLGISGCAWFLTRTFSMQYATAELSVVTDHIDTFTETGLQLRSGEHLAADIVVTATGLVLKLMSGLQLVVDGAPVDLSKTRATKG